MIAHWRCQVCYLCTAGFYCPEGSNYRQSCPAHAISDEGAYLRTQCECQAGFYGIAGGACTACEFATFCPGQGNRFECPVHALSVDDSPRTSKLHCICKAGYYGANGEACEQCPGEEGSETAAPFGARCIASDRPAQFASNTASSCKLCVFPLMMPLVRLPIVGVSQARSKPLASDSRLICRLVSHDHQLDRHAPGARSRSSAATEPIRQSTARASACPAQQLPPQTLKEQAAPYDPVRRTQYLLMVSEFLRQRPGGTFALALTQSPTT